MIPALLFLALPGCVSQTTRGPTAARARGAPENVRVLVLDARWLTEGNALGIDLTSLIDALARAPVEATLQLLYQHALDGGSAGRPWR